MRRGLIWSVCFWGASGCFDPDEGGGIEAEGMATHFAVLIESGRAVAVSAAPIEHSLFLTAPEGATLIELGYGESLIELGLGEGPVNLVTGTELDCSELGRPLPPAAKAQMRDPSSRAWAALDPAMSAAIERVRIEPLDLVCCGTADRCATGVDASLYCRADCAPSAPAAAAVPASPNPPRNLRGEQLYRCPTIGPDAADDRLCLDFGHPCPGGDGFGPARDPSTIYVDPRALPGGDGTRATPFATLASALDVPRPGATVLIATGTVSMDNARIRGVRLEGVCPHGTVVLGVLSPDEAPLSLRALHFANSVYASSGSLSLEEVMIDGNVGAESATVAISVAYVAQGLSFKQSWVSGADAIFGAEATIGNVDEHLRSRIQLARIQVHRGRAVLVQSDVEIEDWKVIGSPPSLDSGLTFAQSVGRLTRASVEDAAQAGVKFIFIGEPRPDPVVLEDLLVRGGGVVTGESSGIEIDGVRVDATRVAIEDRNGTGITVRRYGASVASVSFSDVSLSGLATGFSERSRPFDDGAVPMLTVNRVALSTVFEGFSMVHHIDEVTDVQADGLGWLFRGLTAADFTLARFDVTLSESIATVLEEPRVIDLSLGTLRSSTQRPLASYCSVGRVRVDRVRVLGPESSMATSDRCPQ